MTGDGGVARGAAPRDVGCGLGEFGPSVRYTDLTGRKRWRKGAYIGYNLHELRHTQATLLIGSGADIKTVQQRLGHSSASLTMDIYAHFTISRTMGQR